MFATQKPFAVFRCNCLMNKGYRRGRAIKQCTSSEETGCDCVKNP